MFKFFVIFFLIFYVCFTIATIPYNNPYKLIMIFGKKGSGKTTFLAKKAFEAQKRGKAVYANFALPGVHLLEKNDLGFFMIPEGAIVLWDEAGMQFDNRSFKSFKNETRDWFKLQRHYRITVYLASQTFDVDKKLRDLCDEMILVERKFKIFAYGKRILKKVTLVEANATGESRIDENLKFDSILFFWAGSRTLTLIPRWAPMFDSFEAPRLAGKEWALDDREVNPLSRRQVFQQMVVNVCHVFKFDKLKRRAIEGKVRAEELEDIDISDIDFEEFFSSPAGDDKEGRG